MACVLYLCSITSHITTLTHYHPHTSPSSHITILTHITLTYLTTLTHHPHISYPHIHVSPSSHITIFTHHHPHTPQDQLPLHITYTPESESIHCSALDIYDASCSKKYRARKPSTFLQDLTLVTSSSVLPYNPDSSVWVWWGQSGGRLEYQEVNQWPLD